MKKILSIVILITIGITQIYSQCFQCDSITKAFHIGTNTIANGANSFAGGNESGATINATNSFVFGDHSSVTQSGGIAIGNNLLSNAANSIVFGQYLTGSGANSITIGTGISNSSQLVNTKNNSIMFGVTHNPSLTIVKPTNGTIGYVGIGTDDPKEMAHVVGKLLIERTDQTASSLQFKHFTPPFSQDESILADPYYWDIFSDCSGLKFNTIANNGMGSQRMIISQEGSVGIGAGITTPSATLDVNGSFKAQSAEIEGALTANGVDLVVMNDLLFQKVEELTLHIIQVENRLAELESKKGGE